MGPRDIRRHSKWPRALRMHGSVAPKLVAPLLGIGMWSALITTISEKVHTINVHPIVITVLGLVVGLALNLRSQTAYERYMEGRRMWAMLGASATSLARHIWLHVKEGEGSRAKTILISKTAALNLITGFVIALKHKLRFEPYATYDDLHPLIAHLDTFAINAGEPEPPRRAFLCKKVGYWMGFPMARSNPRKQIKRAKHPVGNLPLEILSHLSAYLTEQIDMGTFELGIAQNQSMNVMNDLHHILATTERVQTTPLPLAYSITISQITWVYLLTLPFQLTTLTGWLCIPITITTAYIVLGILYIGNELENPFGTEVNNLPLENYCEQIVSDVHVIAAISPAIMKAQIHAPQSQLLYPLSLETRELWSSRSEDEIRVALTQRADPSKTDMWERLNDWRNEVGHDEGQGSAQSDTVCGDCEQGQCRGGNDEHSPGNGGNHRPSWRGSRIWDRSSFSKGTFSA
ncbi:uncharacterized protein CC84DRAFT_1126339 [Paraphaeosphaeria sporulosa]|uniref:Membrane protein n=1 Tax=Paraphaeosphaeria sporulosa TaxID=1460663 RepID=A0A177C3I2_9PLEO|nr:uncharacterized protein CC84DRAFT_1126339 [Paraphaeosphaeria sporulosa]OAG02183.1 membrane protein [Paraphaeosphaeria sporulosa]